MVAIKQETLIFAEADKNSNKFYKLFLMPDGRVEAEYGRVGSTLQKKSYTGGQYEFDKIISSKLKKGYTKAKVIEAGQTITVVNNDFIEYSSKELESLVKKLHQWNVHNVTSSTSITYSNGVFSTPLGVVSQDGIDEARKLLVDIDKNLKNEAKLKQIVSQYLRIIPHDIGFKFDVSSIFPDRASVEKEEGVLDSLEASLLQATPQTHSTKTEKNIQVKIDLLQDQKEIDRIKKKYKSTAKDQHVCRGLEIKTIYTVEIIAAKKLFDAKGAPLGNVMELWHGTGKANLLSILKTGLKIAPPSTARIAGKMFGNGAYFAIHSTKSLNYSYGYWSGSKDKNCFMFLADVALGNYQVPPRSTSNMPSKGYHSYWAKPNQSGVQNDEIIIFNECQHNLKYLIEFEE